jgi:hypothetical protein
MHRMGRRAYLPALALLGLLVIFGHDALMAADPHGRSSASAEHAPVHTSTEVDCHLQEGVRTEPSGVPDSHATRCVLHLLPIESYASHLEQVSWTDPPVQPPDILRALLQVFLN